MCYHINTERKITGNFMLKVYRIYDTTVLGLLIPPKFLKMPFYCLLYLHNLTKPNLTSPKLKHFRLFNCIPILHRIIY